MEFSGVRVFYRALNLTARSDQSNGCNLNGYHILQRILINGYRSTDTGAATRNLDPTFHPNPHFLLTPLTFHFHPCPPTVGTRYRYVPPTNVQGLGVEMSYANSMFWFKCAARGGFERAGERVGMLTAEMNLRCPLFGKRVVSIR